MGKKDKHTGEASAAPSSRLTPMDIQQKEFRVSRFGGYKMRDVDEFLDQITDTFSEMSAEIERLRAGGAAPVVGSPDLDDVSRQADEIIARARAEATRITAEARAAASGGAGGGSAERSAVNAFIVREREFLQSLAGLVQDRFRLAPHVGEVSLGVLGDIVEVEGGAAHRIGFARGAALFDNGGHCVLDLSD